MTILPPNKGAAANRRPAGQSSGSGDLSATVAADRRFRRRSLSLVVRPLYIKPSMNGSETSPQPPEQARSAIGIILTLVCTLSGIATCIQLARVFSVWLALAITVIIGLVLVASLAASLGNDLLDVVVGIVVVIIVMGVVVPAGARAFRRHFPQSGGAEKSVVAMWPNQSAAANRRPALQPHRFGFRSRLLQSPTVVGGGR